MRVGLVGCGRWGIHILRDLLALGCDVPVVARSEASRARAREGGATEIVAAVSGLTACTGVVVATSTSSHAQVLDEALALDVPVFVEKPLCADPGQARRLAAIGGDRLFVMDKWRYHPGVLELSRIARDGELGPVQGLRSVRIGWGSRHDDVDAIWALAPHDLAIGLEILGDFSAPLCAVGTVAAGGATLHGLLGVGSVWHALEVSDRSPVSRRRVELHCADGVAVLDGGWSEHISVFRGDPGGGLAERQVAAAAELPLAAELRAFVHHLAGGPPPRSSAEEGSAIVETIARLRALAGLA